MSKRMRTLLIALAAVLVLGGGLAAVLLFTEKPEDNDDSSQADTSISLIDKTKDKNGKTLEKPVAKVAITTTGETFTLEKDADGILAVPAYAGLPVHTDQVETLTKALASISATRRLDHPQAPAEYGFDKPQAKVAVTYADGSLYAFELGMMSQVSDEAYFRVTDSDDVYMVDKSFAETVLQKSTAYIGTSLISAPIVKEGDENGKAVLRDITLTGSVRNNQELAVRRTNSEDSDTMALYAYMVEKPFYRGANDENAKAAFESAYSLTADTAVVAHPTAKQKTEYGFDKPYSVAHLHVAVETTESKTTGTTTAASATGSEEDAKTKYYNVQEHTVTVGKKADGDQYYVMVDDLDVIYLVSAGSIPWVDVTYNGVASTMLFLQDITAIHSIAVTEKGNTITFSLSHDAEATSSDDMLTVRVGGKQTDTANFRQLYQVLMSVKRIDDAEKKPTGTPDMVIQLNPIDNRDATITAQFYKTSGSRYTCVMQDGDVYAVSAGTVEAVSKQMANYLNGKDVAVY